MVRIISGLSLLDLQTEDCESVLLSLQLGDHALRHVQLLIMQFRLE